MLDDVKRFDMQRPPMRQHLLPIAWLLAALTLIPHRNKLKKIRMEDVKPTGLSSIPAPARMTSRHSLL